MTPGAPSLEHHNYSCPHVLPIIKEVTNYFLDYTPSIKSYIMGVTSSPLDLSIKKEYGCKIASLIFNMTVHMITNKRRAKQVLVGNGIILKIISKFKYLLLTHSSTKLSGIIKNPLLTHFLILNPDLLYTE